MPRLNSRLGKLSGLPLLRCSPRCWQPIKVMTFDIREEQVLFRGPTNWFGKSSGGLLPAGRRRTCPRVNKWMYQTVESHFVRHPVSCPSKRQTVNPSLLWGGRRHNEDEVEASSSERVSCCRSHFVAGGDATKCARSWELLTNCRRLRLLQLPTLLCCSVGQWGCGGTKDEGRRTPPAKCSNRRS